MSIISQQVEKIKILIEISDKAIGINAKAKAAGSMFVDMLFMPELISTRGGFRSTIIAKLEEFSKENPSVWHYILSPIAQLAKKLLDCRLRADYMPSVTEAIDVGDLHAIIASIHFIELPSNVTELITYYDATDNTRKSVSLTISLMSYSRDGRCTKTVYVCTGRRNTKINAIDSKCAGVHVQALADIGLC
jgi:hypothetical protein